MQETVASCLWAGDYHLVSGKYIFYAGQKELLEQNSRWLRERIQ